MSNQDEPGTPDPGHRPEDYLRTNPDGSQTPQYPGQGGAEPPADPYASAEPSSFGSPPPPAHGSPPAPPTQPYAQYGQDQYAQPYGQDPYGQQGQYGQPPAPYGGYGAPGYAAGPPQHPSATTALVLGLVSLVGLFICLLPIVVAPFAWRTGGRVVREIDAQPGRWSGREQAQAGRIMGMIGTAILALGILAILGLVALLFATAGDVSYVDPVTPGQSNL